QHNQSQNVRSGCTKDHTHSNFGCSLTHDRGQNAVKTYRGKKTGDSSENADENNGETSWRHRLVHEGAHWLHITQRKFGIELGDRGANGRTKRFGTSRGSNEPSTARSRTEECFNKEDRFATFR